MTAFLVIGIAVTSAGAGGHGSRTDSTGPTGARSSPSADHSSEVAYWHRLAVKRLRLLGARERRIVHLLKRLQGGDAPVPARHQRGAVSGGVRGAICTVFGAHCSEAPARCLDELVQRESGWDVHATNPTTGAYGLPQALPGSKMASAGPDWRDNPRTQIRWMFGYVRKYGGPCGALAFQKAHGWY